jgi:4a-hydroxytetrahydrobiopterin dehydratase
MEELANRHCEPCHGGTPRLEGNALQELAAKLPDWQVVEERHLARTFHFPDFRQALDFVNQAGEVAEVEGHHPDLCLSWGKVEVRIFTHAIGGLSENDFILAAKLSSLKPA